MSASADAAADGVVFLVVVASEKQWCRYNYKLEPALPFHV